jgi:hypothetical protein
MSKIKRNRKMTPEDVQGIVSELRRWQEGEMGLKLNWEKVEKFSGFTKPALHAKQEIREAFKSAKQALQNPDRKSASRLKDDYAIYLENRIKSLNGELEQYKKLENDWLGKWQRIAYHLRVHGLLIEDVDKVLPSIMRT